MNDRKKKVRRLRLLSMTAVSLLVITGMIAGLGTGSLSAFGLKNIYSICPVGYLETVVAGWDIMPHVLIFFIIIILITILFGRIFCGWICPIPLVRKIFANKMDEPNDLFLQDGEEKNTRKLKFFSTKQGKKTENTKSKKYSSYGLPVLIGVLVSSAIFRYPVFCLFCPIGLTFATAFAFIRLFGFHEPTLDLIIFPVIILLELTILRKWCSKFCPIGAFFSLVSRLNSHLVPTVDQNRCLETTKGVRCHQCQKSCTYDIDLAGISGSGQISDCSKCKECAVNCPVQAISFPWKKTADTNTFLQKNEN